MSVKPLEQEAGYFARREFARRQQALVEQASRAAEGRNANVYLPLSSSTVPRVVRHW